MTGEREEKIRTIEALIAVYGVVADTINPKHAEAAQITERAIGLLKRAIDLAETL